MPVATANKKPAQKGAGQQRGQAVRPLPFVACAHEHTEPGPVITKALSEKSAPETFEFDVPSYGYYRSIYLLVELTGGEKEAEYEQTKDAPWNLIEQLTLLDTNGAPIYGPLSGYNNLVSMLYDGFTFQQDPRTDPQFVGEEASKNPNFFFKIRIPTEIAHHSGVGSLGNQNASAPYRIRLTINGAEKIWPAAKKLKKYPTVKITPILEAWTLPNKTDAKGRPQSQLPPSYGTVMFHSERVVKVVSGQYQVPILRVGGLIRWICFVGRKTNAEGERSDKVAPTQPILFWDGRQLNNEPKSYRQTRSFEPINSTTALGRPTGVLAYTFNRTALDRCGDERPYLYLPTTEATRLELEGNFEEEGVVVVVTCEVAPAEVNPAQRYVESNATAFHPMGGAVNPNQV